MTIITFGASLLSALNLQQCSCVLTERLLVAQDNNRATLPLHLSEHFAQVRSAVPGHRYYLMTPFRLPTTEPFVTTRTCPPNQSSLCPVMRGGGDHTSPERTVARESGDPSNPSHSYSHVRSHVREIFVSWYCTSA